MSYFSAVLHSLMDTHGHNQSQLSRLATIAQGQISNYLSDSARPDTATLSRLCSTFAADGPSLLVAFLRDLVPADFRDTVKITTTEAGEPPPQRRVFISYNRLQPRVQELISDLVEKCESDARVVSALESIRQFVDEP